ncbi:MAG: Asp-tRNA(Asn)/Glu-tRNA(Gln) amidotransferase GatCAB subunit A, partial [Planctomycetaceae bacterium]
MSITGLSVTELRHKLGSRELKSVDLTRACLDQITARDSRVQAFLSVNPEESLAQAQAVDERRARGEPLGLLAGIPVAIKDVICQQGT